VNHIAGPEFDLVVGELIAEPAVDHVSRVAALASFGVARSGAPFDHP
jgi:hypothetical protein